MTDPAAIPLEVSAAINVLEKHVRACDPECVAAFQHVYQFLLGRIDALRSATLLHEQVERERAELRDRVANLDVELHVARNKVAWIDGENASLHKQNAEAADVIRRLRSDLDDATAALKAYRANPID